MLVPCWLVCRAVIRRVSVVPPWYNDTHPLEMAREGYLSNSSDFTELGGADWQVPGGEKAYPVGTINLLARDVLTVSMDFTNLPYNLTYGEHYQIGVYVDCKPCPTQYRCNYLVDPPTCETPSKPQQEINFKDCLSKYSKTSCMLRNGITVPCSNTSIAHNSSFQEPDLFKCMQIPFFCDDKEWPRQKWKTLVDPRTGHALPGYMQTNSTYEVDPDWQAQVNAIANPQPQDLFYVKTLGCCRCEKHRLPYFFRSTAKSDVDPGYLDNKHNFLMLEIQALEASALTVVVELLHGQYYTLFDTYVKGKTDISIHRPSRANYVPGKNTRAAFTSMIVSSEITGAGIDLPMNLPIDFYRDKGVSHDICSLRFSWFCRVLNAYSEHLSRNTETNQPS